MAVMKRIVVAMLLMLTLMACKPQVFTAAITAKGTSSVFGKAVTIGTVTVHVTDEEYEAVNVGDIYTCTVNGSYVKFKDCVRQE